MIAVTQGRRGRPRLQTVANVVSQAIALVEEHGAAGLTMSSLARRLGVATMTLYTYVPSRDALVDLMVGRLLDEQPAPPSLGRSRWIDELVDYMAAVRAWGVERPALFHLMNERPRLTDDVVRHVQADLDALTGLGFTPQQAITLRHTLSVHLNGQLEFERRRRQGASQPPELRGSLSEAVDFLRSADQAELYRAGVRALVIGFAPLLDAT